MYDVSIFETHSDVIKHVLLKSSRSIFAVCNFRVTKYVKTRALKIVAFADDDLLRIILRERKRREKRKKKN